MAITIARNSAEIHFTARPTVLLPARSGTKMNFKGTPIRATGKVTLNGAPGDNASGWTVGFLQAQWIETNWCDYRGQHNSDGSMFLQRGRPPARPQKACRDCVDGSPVNADFYDTQPPTTEIAKGGPGAFPQVISVTHFDNPSDDCRVVEMNSKTGKPNFLHEAMFEFHFCTVLTVRDPAGVFHHQCSFYWNYHWQTTFHPTSFTNPPAGFSIHPTASGTGAHVGGVIPGAPIDTRFTGVLTTPQTKSCNTIFRSALAAVHAPVSSNRHEATTWANFNIGRA